MPEAAGYIAVLLYTTAAAATTEITKTATRLMPGFINSG